MPKKTFFNLPDEKRRNIIDIALDEFAAHGFAKTSINSIVARADISKGSIYQYFDDKKDFYLYLVRFVKELYVEHRSRVVGDIRGQSLRVSLKKTIMFFHTFIEEHPNELRFYCAMLGDTSIAFADEIAEIMTDPSIRYVRELIFSAKERGELADGIDENILTFELVALITSFQQVSVNPSLCEVYGMDSESISSLAESADRLIDLVMDGISSR
ncbi:MAG TPA: TetR/AcrR family transcriptional regulator [candidate division Zixibacteria bacterium]|nr:TetR/AcrR family transcriptional regulator [candidate division Zixibacteria bacterium]